MEVNDKQREFSFVFHNVSDYQKKYVLEDHVKKKAVRYCCSCEEYPHQPGDYHLHLFIRFKNRHYFQPTIKHFQEFALRYLVGPEPPNCKGDWGRVEVDQQRGTYEEALAYLQGHTKDKPIDPNISEYESVEKGHIRCDVCKQVFEWFNTQYQYMNAPGEGRCYMCAVWKHSFFEMMGINVRNMDEDRKKYLW